MSWYNCRVVEGDMQPWQVLLPSHKISFYNGLSGCICTGRTCPMYRSSCMVLQGNNYWLFICICYASWHQISMTEDTMVDRTESRGKDGEITCREYWKMSKEHQDVCRLLYFSIRFQSDGMIPGCSVADSFSCDLTRRTTGEFSRA